jgi:hypothetical protein
MGLSDAEEFNEGYNDKTESLENPSCLDYFEDLGDIGAVAANRDAYLAGKEEATKDNNKHPL